MPRKKTCRTCSKLFSDKGRCGASKGLDHRACKKYKKGRPYSVKSSEDIEWDPEQPGVWTFWLDDQVLVLSWGIDHNNHGSWTVKLLGLDDQGVIQKQFSRSEKAPVFHGEIRIRSVGRNDLFASFGFQDPDIIDEDNNVTNKPKEIRILPKRDD